MTSHSNCTHPSTKADRARCRRNQKPALRTEAVHSTPIARCGTCDRPIFDIWTETDEGYSHCCNDRVEYTN